MGAAPPKLLPSTWTEKQKFFLERDIITTAAVLKDVKAVLADPAFSHLHPEYLDHKRHFEARLDRLRTVLPILRARIHRER